MQELLPCPLDLSSIKQQQQQYNQTIIISPTEAQTQLMEDTTIKSNSPVSMSTLNAASATASSSSSKATVTSATTITNYDNNEDLLVDIDSDPDYQRILTQFRKTMETNLDNGITAV